MPAESPPAPGRLDPSRIFTVPPGVRHLDEGQLARLEACFRAWAEAARGPRARQARERMRLLFLLLRYTGARLGEATRLDDSAELDLDDASAVLGTGPARRRVPLPRLLCRALGALLDGPLGTGLAGRLFGLDHGYVRRVLYARADACGLPRALCSPRALRASRAVELLRSGVPLAVVRDTLGQSSADLAAVYQAYSSEDARHIVRRLAPDDQPLRTSARNSFPCRVQGVVRDGVLAEVALRTYSGLALCSVITVESVRNLGLEPGVPVMATVKAPLVEVVRPGGGPGALRNAVDAVVTAVRATAVVAEISGEAADGSRLCALVGAGDLDDAPLAPGDAVQFRFKALAVVLGAL
jgi:molybdate transport system regulatory protein